MERIHEELPFGSRGGMVIRHYFPLDGEYVLRVRLQRTLGGQIRGLAEPNQLEVRLDGVRIALFASAASLETSQGSAKSGSTCERGCGPRKSASGWMRASDSLGSRF